MFIRLLCISCELLSFFSIFGIQNNTTWSDRMLVKVVNCFHFSVSLGYKTTVEYNKKIGGVLWIAFIFQYLWDTKQQKWDILTRRLRCELLSFFSIFGIQNNYIEKFLFINIVVNCFHFSVSLGYKTTSSKILCDVPVLWIAFIFQYLWDTKQRKDRTHQRRRRCELLSFFSIFGIQNNCRV